MKECYIYALVDPETEEIRYIGRTVQKLSRRLYQHIYKSQKKQHPRAKWIKKLARRGLKPGIRLLDTVPTQHGLVKEKEWTIKMMNSGCGLLNDGIGRGGCNYPKKRIEWTPELDSLLGEIADSRIAERIGCSRKSVTYRRENLGIAAAYDRTRNTRPPPMGGHNKIDLPEDIIDLLGTMSDEKVAKAAGVSKKRIMVARHTRGIESWGERNNHPTRYKEGNYPKRWTKQE